MSIAAWRVWRRRDKVETGKALRFFFTQLVLNAFWSVLFFGLQKPQWALVEIIALW